jgi:hypothetical protein
MVSFTSTREGGYRLDASMPLGHYRDNNAMNQFQQGGGAARDSAMPVFRVKFLKRVCDATGHETSICQRVFEIHASDQEEAIGYAKTQFTDAEATAQWWLRADRIETEPVREKNGNCA